MRPRPYSTLAGVHLNPAPFDSQTRGTLSLPKRKVILDGCAESQKDPPHKRTVSVGPESTWLRGGWGKVATEPLA